MKCVEVYKELYHQEPFDVAFCPYRISPLGAHIDHQYGKINGLAIDKGIHMEYPYFKGLEADRYSFYRVPKALVKADLFQKMSGDAKLLYAVLLDRMSLSIKNGWQDMFSVLKKSSRI